MKTCLCSASALVKASLLFLMTLIGVTRVTAQPSPPPGAGTTNCTTAAFLAEIQRTNHVLLNCSATITITNPIVVSGELTIEAGTRATLSGNNVSRIFSVLPGATLTLINITLSGGKGAKGGAINNQGKVIATNCMFMGNNATGPSGTNGVAGKDGYPNGTDGANGIVGTTGLGGAIWSNGELYLTHCTFATNSATGGNGGAGGKGGNAINGFNSGDGGDGAAGAAGKGGAIFTSYFAEIIECVFENNTAIGGNGGAFGAAGTGGISGKAGKGGLGAIATGAAIHNVGDVVIRRCTLSGNRADGGNSAGAGGVDDQGNGDSALAGAQAWGGAICTLSFAEVVNSTFSTNRVFGGDGGKGADGSLKGGRGGDGGTAFGGNLYNDGSASIKNCTFAGGAAVGGTNGVGGTGATPGSGGVKGANRGGNLARVGGTLGLKNTIVARPGNGGNGYGAVLDTGYNLSSDSTLNLNSGTSIMNVGPSMGGLLANGGFGRTFALASHSVAIDAGDPSDESPQVDQRGFPIFGEARDIGAYEFGASASQITVHVEDEAGTPVPGVQIFAAGKTNVTDSLGNAFLPELPAGEYTVIPSHSLYNFEPPLETITVGSAVNLTFTARRAFSISGFVRDGAVGINDVTVTVGNEEVVTDTNGFYSVSGLDVGSYTVEVTAAGYGFVPSLQQVNLQANTTNVNFTAVGLLSISGRIRTEGGQGLNGVVVRAGNRSGVTGGSGDYTISQVPSRPQVVTPSLAGYSFNPASLTVTPIADETGIDFTAFTSFQVSGVVTNTSNGFGANAVTITLRTNAALSGPPSPGTSTILATDTNGFFAFTNVRAGTYIVSPSKTGHGFLPTTNLITVGPSTNLGFAMFPAFSMSGRLTAGSTGLSNATVLLQTNGTEVTRTTTSTSGSYSFDGYPAGTYLITPQVSGYQFTPSSRTLNLAGTSNNLDFTSAGVYAIRGRVTKGGNALPNVTVRCAGALSITDANGAYALTNLPPGTYTVTADDPRYSMSPLSATVAVPPDQANINFEALEVYSVSGEVTEGAFPLAGARVTAGGVTNFTSANGRYTLARVPAGSDVIVSVALPGYEFTPGQQSIVVDTIRSGVNFTARGLSAISGRITNSVTGPGQSRVGIIKISVSGRYETETSPFGFYAITNIGPGLHTVLPSGTNRGFFPASKQITVLTNSITNNVDFAVFNSWKLFGRIVFEETTNGISGVTLRAEGPFSTNTVTTDANGNYVFPILRNGFYRLIPTLVGQGFDPQIHEVDLNADTQRDFIAFQGFSVTGRIIDAATSAGVGGIQVNVNTRDIASTLTDSNGNYSFTGLHENDYTVTPVEVGYDYTPSGRQISVGPNNATAVNFVARGNLTISGRVLDGPSGMPDMAIRLLTTNGPIVIRTNISSAAGTFLFTNLAPVNYIVQPIQSDLFTPSDFFVHPITNYPALDFVAKGGRLSIARSNTFAKINLLRALPLRSYTLQTNSSTHGSWGTVTTRLTDTNGNAEFLYPLGTGSSRAIFRTQR